ncbi:hypothetical protein cypCar_00019544 [Cyprinus carpio]|nr:hypothetical protein cypCar_00019544 [Cyprinus carpio]
MMEICVWKGLILALFFFAVDGHKLRPIAVDRPRLEPFAVDGQRSGPWFLVTFPAVIESGSDAKLCAILLKPNETLTMTVSLLDDKNNVESVWKLNVVVKGKCFKMTEERKVMFRPYLPLTFIQTDKPIYNPGQTVNFRVVTMDAKFVPLDQTYSVVVVEDNQNNRIGQWTNVSSTRWILQLSHGLNPEAPVGMYTLRAFIGDRTTSQVFEVKKYVLPKFEVTVKAPQMYSVGDLGLEIKVSASDFSGKPIASKAVYLLDGSQWPTKLLLNLTTNQNGLADFSLNTADLPKADLSLVASATPEVVYGYRSPYFNSETRTVKLLQPASPYSPTFSELTIVKLEQPLKCGANYPVTIKYSFVGETGDYNTDIIYMVLSKGVIVRHGFHRVKAWASNTIMSGTVSFQLSVSVDMPPVVQILAFCILPSENVVAASASFDTEMCFQNQVFSLLPVRSLSDYPFGVEDEQECLNVRPRRAVPTGQAYEAFKSVGLKIATNLPVREPQCLTYRDLNYYRNFFYGLVNVTVSASAEQSKAQCGTEIVIVPERGRIDVVTRSLLVLPEGVERTNAQSWLLCPKGYQGQLNYRHSDGSYSTFGYDESNTWLTAFVLRSFGLATRFVFIDPNVLQSAKDWLMSQQGSNGCFMQRGTLYHNDMKGGVDDNVTMTAYITASLLELSVPVTDLVITNALSCLRPVVGNLGNTYTTALLTYTFSLAGETSTRAQLLTILNNLAISEGTKLHWSQTSSVDTLAVEISSYVLLAVLAVQPLTTADLGYANRIVNWLVAQQNPYGGFSSTQDTVVALQALSTYATQVFSLGGSSTVTVQSSEVGGDVHNFDVTRDNRLLYQEKPLKTVPGIYNVKATGSTCVSVQVACFYNIPTPIKVARTLSVEAKVTGDCQPLGANLILSFTVTYDGPKSSTNMVIVDIKLLSGFMADTSPLGSPPNSFAPLVERVDARDDHVLVYLKEVSKCNPMSYNLQLKQVLAVNNLKPAVINVYDYYQPSDAFETTYTSPCP